MGSIKGFMERQKAKAELKKAFKSAGMVTTYKNGDKEITIYPKIHDVHIDKKEKLLRYTFTLLNGMDPKEVKKKEFVFKQHFGKNINLDGDLKKYVLTVFHNNMPTELTYNAAEIRKELEDYKLGIICGKDRNGRYVSFDLLKNPHILEAGETGSGKSTQLRSILTTLILTKKPSELQLYLGDCKKSEFHIFRNVEHVQCVLSQPKEIGTMLKLIKKELDERSNLTEMYEVGHVDELPTDKRRPYIVVCIDEFVMLRKDETIMDTLVEISALGRTLGIFLILSMQRPNAKTLDTTIRANLTVSMGFKLRDAMESKIANTPNAHEIEVEGRFIMNSNKIYELQAPFLTQDKAKELLNPFMVPKEKVKDVTPEDEIITEKDVFYDVIAKPR